MRGGVVFKDHRAAFLRALAAAQDKALIAGATVLKNAVKRGLRGGYTSGDFVTGTAMNSVVLGPVERTGDGASIQVGTPLDYPMYWELGHLNLFTVNYERVPIWEPAYLDNRERVMETYDRVLKARLKGTDAASYASGGEE